MTSAWRTFSMAVLSAAALSAGVVAQRGGGPAGPQPSSTPEPLKFRYMGPAAAGRIATGFGRAVLRRRRFSAPLDACG